MDADPLNKQRSPWIPFEAKLPTEGARWYYRNVHDGALRSCVADEPGIGWHLSISFVNHKGETSRYPSWDEIAHARDCLLPAEFTFVMILPPAEEYVAVHRTTFHLHQFGPASGTDA